MAIGVAVLPESVAAQRRLDRRRWRLLYTQVVTIALVCAGLAYLTAPKPFSIAFLGLVILCIAVVISPILGIYGSVLMTMVGDNVTVPWYPFTKNLSSHESILFVADGLTINPFEITIFITAMSWILRVLGDSDWRLYRGALYKPMLVFTGFVLFGLVYGLGRGGNTTIAVWEVRPLLYIPIMYVLITNLLTTARQYELMFMCAVVGVIVQSLLALQYFRSLDPQVRENLESLTEHAASIQVAALVIFVFAIWLLPRCSHIRRIWLTVGLVPCVWMFVLSQRRAAAIALIVGVFTLGILLFQRRRKTAVWFLGFTVILGGAYTAAFWNSTGSIGFAAQAVKTVIAPGTLSWEDQSSDLYRQAEAYNVWFSIRASRLFGLGFGQPFLQPLTLPDISFFVFADYMPHNSILWIWIKTGVGGFMAMLYLFARTIHRGVRLVIRVQSPNLTSVAIGSLVYVVMYIVYSYVDIGWDIRSTVFLAVAIAICSDLDNVLDQPDEEAEELPTTEDSELVS